MSPHDNVRWHLAQEWVSEGQPRYELPAFSRLPRDIAPALTPRDAASTEGAVVPKDFPYALAAVAVLAAINPAAPTYLTLLSALGVLVAVALVAYELTRSRLSTLLTSLFVTASTYFWAGSSGLLETGATTAMFLLVGLLVLCRSRRPESSPHLQLILSIVGGACFGMAVGFHHAALLLAGGIILAFSLRRFGGSIRIGLLMSAGLVAALLPLIAFNVWLYGSPLTTGYDVGADFYDSAVRDNSGGLVDLQARYLVSHLGRYVARPEVLVLLAGAILGWAALRRSSSGSTTRALGASLLIGGIPYLVFTGARPLWGSEGVYVANASFLRYAFPIYAVVAVLAAGWVIAPTRRYRWARIAVAIVVLVGAARTTTGSAMNPIDYRGDVLRAAERQKELLSVIPTNALVITAKADKLIWPQRSTLTAAFLADRQPNDGHLYDLVPSPDRLADVLARLYERGEDVWLYDDGGWLTADITILPTMNVLLHNHGIQLRKADGPALYRLSRTG